MKLNTLPHDDTTQHSVLQAVAFGIRSTFHSSLQASPGQITFGRDMIITSTYLANWKFIRAHQKKNTLYNNARENKKRIQHDYQPGQNIYILNKDIKRKLNPIKEGPFRIVRIHTNGTLVVRRSPTVIETVNIRRVHPAP